MKQIVIVLALLLTACGKDPQPGYNAPAAIVTNVLQGDNEATDICGHTFLRKAAKAFWLDLSGGAIVPLEPGRYGFTGSSCTVDVSLVLTTGKSWISKCQGWGCADSRVVLD